MTSEENVTGSLVKKFAFLDGKIRVQRPRRIFIETPYDKFEEVFKYAVNNGFPLLCTITGLDEVQTFGFLYHIASVDGTVLTIKVNIPKDKAVLKTIMPYFPNAEIYEREIEDLLGVTIEGLSKGKRYPLPDDWPEGEYPLRKDWKPKDGKVKEGGQNA